MNYKVHVYPITLIAAYRGEEDKGCVFTIPK